MDAALRDLGYDNAALRPDSVHLDTDLLVCASVLESAVRTVHAELLDLAYASEESSAIPGGHAGSSVMTRASDCEDMLGTGNARMSFERIVARLAPACNFPSCVR